MDERKDVKSLWRKPKEIESVVCFSSCCVCRLGGLVARHRRGSKGGKKTDKCCYYIGEKLKTTREMGCLFGKSGWCPSTGKGNSLWPTLSDGRNPTVGISHYNAFRFGRPSLRPVLICSDPNPLLYSSPGPTHLSWSISENCIYFKV